jgi:hypothetical protein
MASWRVASADITVKMVVPVLASRVLTAFTGRAP